MTPVVMGGATLYLGDCIEVMRGMANASVDSIVTDPPYHLTNGSGGPAKGNDSAYSRARAGATSTGFMGQAWDGGDIAQRVEMWVECLRVLKPGGHLLAFSGTRTQHRMVCAIEDAGFEVRDQFGWAYGSGFPKSRNIAADMLGRDAEEWAGWGTAVKPAWEPICFARKPLAKGMTVAANVLVYGTGALNIDACRVSYENDTTDPASNPLYRRQAGYVNSNAADDASSSFALKDGSGQRNPNDLGRWPANIIHDGSDEVLEAFPQAPGQMADAKISGERKTSNVYGVMRYARVDEASADSDNDGVVGFKMKPGARRLDTGSAARFFYCAKTSTKDRNEGLEDFAQIQAGIGDERPCGSSWERRAPEKNPNAPRANIHPTVKPTDLMAYLCRLVTPPGGTVLDPFMGSGSTGKAAMREAFKFIGIDMTPEYVDIATARISHEIERVANVAFEARAAAELAARQPDLFAPELMKQEQASMFAEAP